jgi:alpha-L-fucosidase
MFPQVKELMTEYGEVGLIWFDVPRVPFCDEQAQQIVEMMRDAQPGTLINGRLGKQQFVDYLVSGDNGAAGVPTDFYWETPASINHTYGYGVADQDWKSWEELAEIMVKVIAHNGNYLLNIGPKSDGSVPKESVKILHQLGQWVKLNSEAIFDTQCTPYRADSMTTHEWGTCTRRDSTLYLFVQNWPKDGKIDLPLIKNQVNKVSYFAVANKAKLTHSRSIDSRGNTVITIDVPRTAPDAEGIIVLKAEFEGKVELDPILHTYDKAKQQIVLEGRDFHAITAPKTGIYYDREMGAIHGFRGADAPVWVFNVPESGEYELTILGSGHRNLSKNKKNTIRIDKEPVLDFTVQLTKAQSGGDDWLNFKPHTIGTVSLEKGRSELAIIPAPRQKGWNMAIKNVTLKKVQ